MNNSMSNHSCKLCSSLMMAMGYCNEHWQEVKATWTPAYMGQQSTPTVEETNS